MDYKTIFVTGPESSGSTFTAQTINKCFYPQSKWNGRGFNCCSKRKCDKDNNYLAPCTDVDFLICHRSIPFGKPGTEQSPPIKEWDRISPFTHYIFCTRDMNIMEKSTLRKTPEKHVRKWISSAVETLETLPVDRTFIFNYESMILTGNLYLSRLYDFLELPLDWRHYPSDIKDGNHKYIK